MANPLRILLALAFASAVSASIVPNKAFVPLSLNKQLSVRGGAGPLDPTMVAKVAIAALLAQGTVSTLAPEKAIKSYGTEPSAISTFFMRRLGVSALSIATMTYGMMFKDWSVNTAAGVEAIIWGTELVRSILNDEATSIGFRNEGMIMWLALHLASAYTSFTDATCAGTVLKAFAIFVIGTCGPLMIFPSSGFKAYGFDPAKCSNLDIAYLKVLGAWITAIGVFLLSISNGSSPINALGYAYVPATVLTVSMLFITKDADKVGSPKSPAHAWLIFNAIIIATLAFD